MATLTCTGIVLATKKPCTKFALENGFCIKHQAQTFIREAKEKGETVCRQFSRGCRNYLSKDDIEHKLKTCSECRKELHAKDKQCEHSGCTHTVNADQRFCGKHVREVYREKERAGTTTYCNVDRGCFSVLNDGEKRCGKCTEEKKKLVIDELAKLRMELPFCLLCDNVKTNIYFCDDCTSKVTVVNTNSSIRLLQNAWNDFKQGALKRDYVITVDSEQFKNTVVRPCMYCGQFALDAYNGVDRVDNTKGYISSNICACCTLCNFMKRDQNLYEFYDKVAAIHRYQTLGVPVDVETVKKWAISFETRKMVYSKYTYSAKKRDIEFKLSLEEFNTLQKQSCYLCGIPNSETHKNGIDRVDSDKGYIVENCRPCCTHCNLMKNNSPLETFLGKCAQIVGFFQFPTSKEHAVLPTTRLSHVVEVYRSKDIYEILDKCGVSEFISWAKKSEKSAQFIDEVRSISLSELTREEAIEQIKHLLEKERKRPTDDLKHFTALSMMATIMTSGKAEFDKVYRNLYGTASDSYERQLNHVAESLSCVDRKEGLELCKKFLHGENNRRRSKRNHEINSTLKTPASRAIWCAKPSVVPENKIIMLPLEKVLEVPHPHSHPNPKEAEAPKQWKSSTIYATIKEGNGLVYKKHCEENNEILDTVAWEESWCILNKNVCEATSYKDVKSVIEGFIKSLRTVRHLKLTKKDVLARDDRQVWPVESVLKAYESGKIEQYKEYVETQNETSIEQRWAQFMKNMESVSDEKKRIDFIRKFQTNLRVLRYRTKLASTTESST